MPDSDAPRSEHTHFLPRNEASLAHAVYGLILSIALLGELIHEGAESDEAVLWLLAGGALLLAAHVFSDALGHIAASEEKFGWTDVVRIGREEVAVVSASIGFALFMAVTGLFGAKSHNALVTCVVLGLGILGLLSQHAASGHGPLRRFVVTVVAVSFGAMLVILENLV